MTITAEAGGLLYSLMGKSHSFKARAVMAAAYLHVVGDSLGSPSRIPALMEELGYGREIPGPRTADKDEGMIEQEFSSFMIKNGVVCEEDICNCTITAFGPIYNPTCPECKK